MKDEGRGPLSSFVNKRVVFRFARQELRFDLSQSLFSSFDIDAGTRLLLKTLAQQVALDDVRSALDVGCGVGVIGVCLKKRYPDIALTVQDRDALALAFTHHNAGLNQIDEIDVPGGLGLQNLNGRKFDLIVSNLPGKAGRPVLEDMLTRMPQLLTESGVAAVVIVKPLADLIEQTLRANGSAVLLREAGKGHVVFHFQGGAGEATADPLAPYLRARQRFKAPSTAYRLQTVYNIPEFDTLGYQTAVAFDILQQQAVNGRVLIWNPGQGHTAVYLHKRFQSPIDEFTLGSRDLLSLTITEKNLQEQGVPPEKITSLWLPDLRGATGQFDFILLFPDSDPGVPWHQHLPGLLVNRLPSGGHALLVAKSVFIQRVLPARGQLMIRRSKKRRGYRALLFQKPFPLDSGKKNNCFLI